MIKTRFLSVFLSVILLSSMLVSCDSDNNGGLVNNSIIASDGTVIDVDSVPVAPAEDFEYTISDSKVFITGYKGEATEVSIPSEIEGMQVASVLSSAFFADEDLYAVIIPEGVTSVKDDAFYGCTSLEFVQLPTSLVSLGESVFANCTSLESLVLPNRITEIPNRCFYGCSVLNSVTMGSSVTKIGDYAFASCNAIYGMTLSSSVESIGEFAFYSCADLNVMEFTGNTVFEKTTFLQSESLTLYVESGTVPHALAQEYSLTYMVKEK
ncbi:MAG: leucine-rich repeat domain-containing protein [Oscillospiraceae bacterium]|nr:leucine-rich repeat domain-containing protein [Oscillospiraceae bacterium]